MIVILLIDRLETGGAETHVVTLARALAARGNRVTVVSSGGVLERELTAHGVQTARIDGAFVRSFGKNVATLARLIRAEHPDVLHAHTRRTALLLWAVKCMVSLAPSRFLTLPTDLSGGYRRASLWRAVKPVCIVTAHARFRPRYRRLSYWGDATVAVSDDLADHIARTFGVAARRIEVIPNGVEVGQDRPMAARVGERRVVFVSRLDRDCSSAAFALLDLVPSLGHALAARGERLTLTLVGGGDCYGEIVRRVEGMDGVHAVGAVTDVTPYLRDADVFVGVSRAALEAIAAGCAVVLAGDEGYGGVLYEDRFDRFARGNFCCRGEGAIDADRLYADVLSLLCMTTEARARLNASLRARVRREYGAARMADRTEAFYVRVLTGRRRLGVLIAGYAGCGNLGDDALLRRLIDRLDGRCAPPMLVDCLVPREGGTRDGQAGICRPPHGVLLDRKRCYLAGGNGVRQSARPSPSVRLRVFALVGREAAVGAPFGVACHDRRRPMRAIWRCDALLLGGGSLLQNGSAHGHRSLAYYTALPRMARWLGRPYHVVSNGLGPLHGRAARRSVGRLLRRARCVSLRDETALRLARSLGVASAVRQVDPVCSLRVPRAGVCDAVWSRLGLPRPGGRYVCIAPRASDPTEALSRLMAKLQSASVGLVLVMLDRRHDRGICRELSTRFPSAMFLPPLDERLIAHIFRRADTVLASRLHALILADLVATPCHLLTPQTDPKFERYGEDDAGVLF